ncbi:uncharacterized protein LOC107760391 [Nicotiana tabacum]|uniref:General transcription factor 3C polypeptide 3-like n=2 Tax=Nicotiana tabacum TaxID=4097 RepID=A0A1S3X268_TOBAC|nr:PREDICTED: general transcription factor 3C polypeptide 3-like [Nicotiana tabacum]XP_016433922.1 PREDICTED: general transcription factor 3C polypeptide 3-like [Nicotiana tabacum]
MGSVESDGSEGAAAIDDCEDNYDRQDSAEEEEFEGVSVNLLPANNYELLAERKRKALAGCQHKQTKKKREEEDIVGASFDEIMEAMSFGSKRKHKKDKRVGRPKGSRNKVNLEARKLLGEATLCYAAGKYTEALKLLHEVIQLEPTPDAYHTLAVVYDAIGEKRKSMYFYELAALVMPRDTSLWKLLLSWSLEQGNAADVNKYLPKAIAAEPEDISLRLLSASHYLELKEYEKAAKAYEKVFQLLPDNIEACISAAKLYKQIGKTEHSLLMLEDYLKHRKTDADPIIIDMLATICIENGEYAKALQHIEGCFMGREWPLNLTAKAGICNIYLGNLSKAETLLKAFGLENANDNVDSVVEIADTFKILEHYEYALHYYLMLEGNQGVDDGILNLKIAQCYLSLEKKEEAIWFFYKAVHSLEDNVEVRISLASLLLEEKKEKEAISLLSSPVLDFGADSCSEKSKFWWHDEKVRLKLAKIYQTKNMLQEFVDVFFPLVSQLITSETTEEQVAKKKKLSTSELIERARVLENNQVDNLFQRFKPAVTAAEREKAARAKRLLQWRTNLKEEMKLKALAAGVDWQSEESDDECWPKKKKKLPTPQLLRDEENHQLVIELAKALASLGRHEEALDVCKWIMPFSSNVISSEKIEELSLLGAQMAYNVIDPRRGYDFVRDILQRHPYKISVWNYYFKALCKMEIYRHKHSRFLRRIREKEKECVPPIIISGHQFSMGCLYQTAAEEYLHAYKLLPDSPFVNLCVGTSLINLAFDVRLKNKHQCVVQGMAFLFKYLKLCGESQEALFNIARAYHHVGLVSLAASYYEKVLSIREKDYPIPRLPYESQHLRENGNSGYCSLHREAAYNLHLIYKTSGALDLARQVLRDYCTL